MVFVELASVRRSLSRLCSARRAGELRLRELRFALALELAEVLLLHALLVAILLERFLQMDQPIAVVRHLIAQLLHAARPAPGRGVPSVQILVSREQLTERLRGQQSLGREERSAFVDVDEPPPEGHALVGELGLGAHHVLRRVVDVAADARELSLQRRHERSVAERRAFMSRVPMSETEKTLRHLARPHPRARRRHGDQIQGLKLDEAGFRGERFDDFPRECAATTTF